MKSDDFLELDYLVFSSHKTMTQSIKGTLNRSGFNCVHAHHLKNIALDDEKFRTFCLDYCLKNKRKLKIISVFREPMERMISSFFQSLSVDKFGRTQSAGKISLRGLTDEQAMEHSILFTESFDTIQQRFWYYCAVRDGFGESIEELMRVFDVQYSEISFHTSNPFSRNQFECFDLYLSRFDLLKEAFLPSLEHLTGTNLIESSRNLSDKKWYSSKYDEFRSRVRVPSIFLTNMYESRKLLGEVFYDDYAALLKRSLVNFGL
ncbi:MAG: hypothetical protein FGM40_01270 [Rhodocyclaceae bacterium]|nr:hypothetical protein [Rhodocyclaceae bacterium]